MKYSSTMSDLLKQVDQKSKDLVEGKLNETGHDDVKSAKNQVQIAMSALQKMSGELGKLNDEDSLPTWWTNKVAVSVDKLDGMADYLDTQVESKQVNEESMKCPRCGTMNETPFDKCSNCGLPKAEFSSFKKEEVEELEEGQAGRFRSAGAELERFAKSSGGMDKNDFIKAAGMMKKGDSHGLVAFAKKLDTSPKEYIIQTVARAVGKDLTQKMFGVKIKEEVELDEKEINYDGKGPIKMSKKEYASVNKFQKSMIKGKPYMMALNPKTQGTELVPVVFEAVELDEKEIRHDGKGPIKMSKKEYDKINKFRKGDIRGKPHVMATIKKGGFDYNMLVPVILEAVDPADEDVVATADDRKAADKNIIMQLRRLQDLKGKGKAMFSDKKTASINPKLIDYALKMHGKMKPQDKLKFQKAISKSHRDFLMTLKRTR